MKKRIEVGENIISLSEAKEYMAEVLDILEWGVQYDTIRTYQRRQGGYVWEEGIVVEYEDSNDRTKSANVHYYVREQGDEHDSGKACLRFGRYCGKEGYESSDMPFYGTAEDAADFLYGWLKEREREDEDEYFELTEEQKNDGYIPHELSLSARRRLREVVGKAARRYALEIERAKKECEAINAKKAKACKIKKAV
jgi:hypothetical protein